MLCACVRVTVIETDVEHRKIGGSTDIEAPQVLVIH